MIDIDKAKKAFDSYVNNYDMDNEMIKLKYDHTFRVCDRSTELSSSLNLNEEDSQLSYLIALLHDIGRFEQMKRYNTFTDSESIDHAKLGCKILFEDGLIREFIKEDTYDEIIKKAIFYHNKYELSNDLNERELMHAKMIRDTDKIDIINNVVNVGLIKINSDKSEISKEVRDAFFNERSISHNLKKTKNDSILVMVAFIFDLNYLYSLKYFKNNEFIEKFNDKIENKEIFKEYIKYAIDYLERKCENVKTKIFT